jgi:hypothetical protein
MCRVHPTARRRAVCACDLIALPSCAVLHAFRGLRRVLPARGQPRFCSAHDLIGRRGAGCAMAARRARPMSPACRAAPSNRAPPSSANAGCPSGCFEPEDPGPSGALCEWKVYETIRTTWQWCVARQAAAHSLPLRPAPARACHPTCAGSALIVSPVQLPLPSHRL